VRDEKCIQYGGQKIENEEALGDALAYMER
jgi:hypothetical protein